MSVFKDSAEVRDVIGGFLLRFPGLDPIMREATDHEPLVMKVELTDPGLTAEIDTTARPLRVRLDSDAEGMIGMSGPADRFHDLLLGRVSMATAINHKQLVVRGSTSKLMNSAPLFYLAPHLYPFYLESIGRNDLVLDGPRPMLHGPLSQEGTMSLIVAKLAYVIGFSLGLIKKHLAPGLNVVATLEELGRGLARASGPPAPEK